MSTLECRPSRMKVQLYVHVVITDIFFFGVRTDRQDFGILIWKHVGTQKISTQSSKLEVSCLYDGDA